MITCLDIENTFTKGNSMPYNGNNILVSVGFLTNGGEQNYLCFYHAEEPPTENNIDILQDIKRRNVSEKKSHIFEEFIKAGKGVDEIPYDKLTEYGVQDVKSAYELAFAQADILNISLQEWSRQ